MYRTLLVAVLLLLTVNWGIASAKSATGVKEPATAQSTDLQWLSSTEVKRAGDTLSLDRALADIDQMPVLRIRMYPDYPPKAKQLALEAKVVVKALVDADGSVRAAKVAESSQQDPNIGFERAALLAAMDSSYRPAMVGGKPVPVWVTYAVAVEPQGIIVPGGPFLFRQRLNYRPRAMRASAMSRATR
jgi:TonB family protein